MWAGVLGIRASSEVFLLLFFGTCKYVCATWKSHCQSKLNAEFSLFYSFLFHHPVFEERETPEKFPHSTWKGSYLWVIQFSLSDRGRLCNLTNLMAASQYDQL